MGQGCLNSLFILSLVVFSMQAQSVEKFAYAASIRPFVFVVVFQLVMDSRPLYPPLPQGAGVIEGHGPLAYEQQVMQWVDDILATTMAAVLQTRQHSRYAGAVTTKHAVLIVTIGTASRYII